MKTKVTKPRAVGVLCGAGSMLVGARLAGFKVVGNVEARGPFKTGETFRHNFRGAWQVGDLDQVLDDELRGIDLVMGMPLCGNFSCMNTSGPKLGDPADILDFARMVARIGPRFFVMDNLPKSLMAVGMDRWMEELPGYDLFPEWVSNRAYGNAQKNRRRFFMIGARRGERFTFRPNERPLERTVRDVIGDLPVGDVPEINHVHHPEDGPVHGWLRWHTGVDCDPKEKVTLREFKRYLRAGDYRAGEALRYRNLKGEWKTKPGTAVVDLDRHSHVLIGGLTLRLFKMDDMNPFTLRERARLQGFPDDFTFVPLDYMNDPRALGRHMEATGKCIPVEFCRYVSRQMSRHTEGALVKATNRRLARPNEHVTRAKRAFCERDEYSDQVGACAACWLHDDCDKLRRFLS